MTSITKRTALFACYGGGHVAMLLPIARHLQQSSEWEVKVLGLTTAGQRLRDAGIPCLGFADLLARFGSERARRHGERLLGDVSHPVVPRAESIAYLGLCYTELEDQLGAAAAATRYAQEGRAAFLPVEIMGKWLCEEKPDVFVATTSPRAERAGLQAARQLSIPTMAVVDFHRPPAPWLMGTNRLADRLCVLAQDSVDFFAASGRSRDEIVITGNPAFDSLADPKLIDAAKQIVAQREWPANELRILWASQIEPEAHPITGQKGDPQLPSKIENALLGMLANNPNWRLILRPHPSESRELNTLPPKASWSTQQEPLHPLLHAVDVVVTSMSTVGLEAALAGKPVVTVDLSVLLPELPLSQMGISRGVTTWPELELALRDVQQGRHPVQPDLPPVGEATERCVAVLEDLLASCQFGN
ncbi:hypothetical protein SH139x_001150 [Planctomycetaceae bacterium SH139]